MPDQIDALRAKLAASENRPGYEQRVTALQDEIAVAPDPAEPEDGGEDGEAE